MPLDTKNIPWDELINDIQMEVPANANIYKFKMGKITNYIKILSKQPDSEHLNDYLQTMINLKYIQRKGIARQFYRYVLNSIYHSIFPNIPISQRYQAEMVRSTAQLDYTENLLQLIIPSKDYAWLTTKFFDIPTETELEDYLIGADEIFEQHSTPTFALPPNWKRVNYQQIDLTDQFTNEKIIELLRCRQYNTNDKYLFECNRALLKWILTLHQFSNRLNRHIDHWYQKNITDDNQMATYLMTELRKPD